MKNQADRTVSKASDRINLLKHLGDAHTSFTLLRVCLGVCRVNYLLRKTPPQPIARSAQNFDNALESIIRHLAGRILSTQIFRELQLPVRIHDTAHPHLGAGITSAVTIAPAAFLASWCASANAANCLLLREYSTHQSVRLMAPINPHARDTHALFCTNARIEPAPAPATAPPPQDLPAHDPAANDTTPQPPHQQHDHNLSTLQHLVNSSEAVSQTALTAVIHKAQISRLPTADSRTQAFRACRTLPAAKEWLKCSPTPGLHTHIPDPTFRHWFGSYCRAPKLFGQTCHDHRFNDQRGCSAIKDFSTPISLYFQGVFSVQELHFQCLLFRRCILKRIQTV